MPEIGRLSIWLALAAAVYGIVASVVGARRSRPAAMESARRAVWAIAGLATLAAVLLVFAFLTHDFRLAFVAANNSLSTPRTYTLAGMWGGQAGSLLLWTWLLSVVAVLSVGRSRPAVADLQPYATAALLGIAAFFLVILAVAENPFATLVTPPPDGRGLNPLLLDPGMLVHPPLLYLGFVGLSVPYSFAMATLFLRRADAAWIIHTRRWTLAAWYFLGAGLVVGGWWAYRTLGWGGYWGWDPVENSALIPWLVATAFLHSVMIEEQREMLRAWNVLLIILAFALSILGTFLTRSGVLISVHTFAQSSIGPWFVAFLGLVLLGSVGLLLWRWDSLRSRHDLDALVSRESAFLLNNLVFLAMALAVLLGTLFPILTEAVRGVKILVGPPYFTQVVAPMALLLLVLMGIGPLLPWRRASPRALVRSFRWPVLAGAVTAAALWRWGIMRPGVLAAGAAVGFVTATIAQEFHRGVLSRVRRWQESYPVALGQLLCRQRRRYGGYLVHAAVLVIAIGVVGSQVYVTEKEATLRRGESLRLGRYSLVFDGAWTEAAPAAQITAAALQVFNQGHAAGRLTVRRHFYPRYQQPVSRPAIRSRWRDDLYVVLVAVEAEGRTATFRAWINPLVRWIWLGGLLFTVGTLIAAWPDGRRPRTAAEARRQRAIDRIRQIDLDFSTGKIAWEDYRRFRQQALADAVAGGAAEVTER